MKKNLRLLTILILQIVCLGKMFSKTIEGKAVWLFKDSSLCFADSIPLKKIAYPILQKLDTPETKEHHAIYLELLGPAFLYSVNYEYFFRLKNSHNNLIARLGFSAVDDILVFPFGISYDMGKKKNKIQINLNRLISLNGENPYTSMGLDPYTSLGLAFVRRPMNDLYYFRLSGHCIIFDRKDNFLGSRATFWPGISIGFTF